MAKDELRDKGNLELAPALRSWIENVIVPALVKEFLAELRKHGQAPFGSGLRDEKETEAISAKMRSLQPLKTKQMLSVSEAADALGLSEQTIRAWIAKRRMPYVRLGRAIRIPADAVREMVEKCTIPTDKRV